MIDRETVIKGLEEAKAVIEGHVPLRYYSYAKQACSDAIELLKADQFELIRQKDRIETLERIVDHMEQSIKEIGYLVKIITMRR